MSSGASHVAPLHVEEEAPTTGTQPALHTYVQTWPHPVFWQTEPPSCVAPVAERAGHRLATKTSISSSTTPAPGTWIAT